VTPELSAAPKPGNRYDRLEWAGAFGDLGTLLPFVLAYIAVVKIDPLGILLGFGVAMIAVGLYYRTPIPVQPMKAIGAAAATQATQTIALTPQAVFVSGLASGLFWLILGATGLAEKVSRLVPRPVALGIVLGLGFAFMLEGLKLMSADWWIAGAGLALTLALLGNRYVPAMFALLVFGAAAALLEKPWLARELAQIGIGLRLPELAIGSLAWTDVFAGVVLLAIPQLPLTFGNAIVAIKEENNRLFPERPVSERTLSLSTGLMNVVGAAIGGVPMCHGAGGMAGHTRFGARTGGSVVILGALLCVCGLLFSGSVSILLQIFPLAILGVILFLTGAQLAHGASNLGDRNEERFATLVTAGCALWNVGLAFILGWLLIGALRRGLVRL
jgi:MFS superfamily sulfate permease-like transporter